MDDFVPIKTYLKANDITKVVDFEEESVSVTKFVFERVFGGYIDLKYLEIDSRKVESIKEILNKDDPSCIEMVILTLRRCYWRLVSYTNVRNRLSVKISGNQGVNNEIHEFYESNKGKFSENLW